MSPRPPFHRPFATSDNDLNNNAKASNAAPLSQSRRHDSRSRTFTNPNPPNRQIAKPTIQGDLWKNADGAAPYAGGGGGGPAAAPGAYAAGGA